MLVTASEVRDRWCFGLPLTKSDGSVMPDADIENFIEIATQEVQRRLDILLSPHKVICNPGDGAIYDIAEDPYDYDIERYRSWGYLQLRQFPIISVEKVRLVLPNSQEVVNFPMDWVKINKSSGQIRIVPYAGNPSIMTIAGATGSSLPLLTGQFSRNFPQALWIDYTAGMQDVPSDIKAVVAKLAAIDVLGISGDAILAGVASISTSVDGLSESFSTTASATNATYGARILQLRGEISDFFSYSSKGERGGGSGGAKSYYKGFTMEVL